MPEQSDIRQIVATLNYLENYTLKLFFITRNVKPDVPKYKKIVDKYEYKTFQVEYSPKLKDLFYNLVINDINKKLAAEGLMVEEYSVISDDLEGTIYTYTINDSLAFSDVLSNQMKAGTNTPTVNSLKEIKDGLWAYCIKIEGLSEPFELFSFRKMDKGTILSDEVKGVKNKIACLFDTNEIHLDVLEQEVVNFDNRIDCIYFNDVFYIFRKNAFQKIVGLEEELKQNAKDVIKELEDTDIFSGIGFLEEEIGKSRMLLTKIANIARTENYKNIDEKRIESMKGIAERLGLNMKFDENNKIVIEDSKDVDLVVKMLDKYYLECMQTGEPFGSHVKKRLA